MKPLTLIAIVIVVLGAVAVGWVYESSSKKALVRAELEIPTDIDFFLSQMNYRVFNKSGNLDYQMRSPYLEHVIRDDISHIQQPKIRVFREGGEWHLEAASGDILHQQEWLQLEDNVILQKLGADSIQVRSETMLFKPDQNLLVIETDVIIESGSAKINGNKAIFNLDNEVYSLKNTKAIYYHAASQN